MNFDEIQEIDARYRKEIAFLRQENKELRDKLWQNSCAPSNTATRCSTISSRRRWTRAQEAMRYKVMIRCLTGTWRLHYNPLQWDNEEHVITWCHCESLDEAERTVADIKAGKSRHLRAVWWEEA
jgi:hypothetical protein